MQFSRQSVESFTLTKAVPPECSFVIEWIGTGKPSTVFHYIARMIGTAHDNDAIGLHINPSEFTTS